MRKIYIFWMLFLLFSASVHSQPRVLGYVNGVCNTRVAALSSLMLARDQYVRYIDEQTIGSSYTVEDFAQQHDTILFYNQKNAPDLPECTKYDFLEAAFQLGILSSVEEFWEFIEPRFNGSIVGIAAHDWVADALENISDVTERMASRDQERIVEGLEYWTSRRQVALLMHSQGNLFGNDSWQVLNSEQQGLVGLISIATPDDGVADDSRSFTHACDWIRIISNTELALPTPVCDLTEEPWCPLECHYFATYLNGTKTAGESTLLINEAIYGTFARLDDPPPAEATVVKVEFAQERFDGIFTDVASTDCNTTTVIDEFRLGERTRLRVRGQNLRDIPLAAFINDCDHMQVEPIDSNPDVVWRDAYCVPSFSLGLKKDGLIKDFAGVNGNVLCRFEVEIVEAPP